jgi:hypothetical protein
MRTGIAPLQERARHEAGEILRTAQDWQELEAKLARLGYRLEAGRHEGGLVITDGHWYTGLSRIDPAFSGPTLAARFRQSFADHRQAHPEPPPVPDWAAERARAKSLGPDPSR